MRTADKLADVTKRAYHIDHTLKVLKLLKAEILQDDLKFGYHYFDPKERFYKAMKKAVLPIVDTEVELLNQELEQLSKPEYLAELLKESDNG